MAGWLIANGRAREDFFNAYANGRGLSRVGGRSTLPPVTPLLQKGDNRYAEQRFNGVLPGGMDGSLCLYTYEDTSSWVEKVSRAVGAMAPELVSWEWAKAGRRGRARLDYTQNAPIKTLVAPYAVRPAAGAPVSAPITWDELDTTAPDQIKLRDVRDRLATIGDPWRDLHARPGSIAAASAALDALR